MTVVTRGRLIVPSQEVFAEIAIELPPHGVNVIGVVLSVVVLEQESWRLDAIVVPLPRLQTAAGSCARAAGEFTARKSDQTTASSALSRAGTTNRDTISMDLQNLPPKPSMSANA